MLCFVGMKLIAFPLSGVGGGGGWGAEDGVKHQFGLKEQCCAFSK